MWSRNEPSACSLAKSQSLFMNSIRLFWCESGRGTELKASRISLIAVSDQKKSIDSLSLWTMRPMPDIFLKIVLLKSKGFRFQYDHIPRMIPWPMAPQHGFPTNIHRHILSHENTRTGRKIMAMEDSVS